MMHSCHSKFQLTDLLFKIKLNLKKKKIVEKTGDKILQITILTLVRKRRYARSVEKLIRSSRMNAKCVTTNSQKRKIT